MRHGRAVRIQLVGVDVDEQAQLIAPPPRHLISEPGERSVVLGGGGNRTLGSCGVVVGGQYNTAGYNNLAYGQYSSVYGGSSESATGWYDYAP